MRASVGRLGVAALVMVAVLGASADTASACSLPVTPISVDGVPVTFDSPPISVRRGDVLRVQGRGFFEIIPEAERPSTTTTTRPDGVELPECPPTRPASSVGVFLSQDGRDAVELARVAGDRLDVDVVIPGSVADGPALLGAGSSMSVPLTVLPGTTVTTRPNELPRTGTSTALPTIAGAVLLAGGAGLVLAARRRALRLT